MLTHLQASHTDALKTHFSHKLFCHITAILNGLAWIHQRQIFFPSVLKYTGSSSRITRNNIIRGDHIMKRFILPLLWGILSGLLFMGSAGLAKEKPSLSASRMTLKAGDSAFIVLQENPNNLVSWSVTSGKKCISLDSAVNYGEQIITAKKPGTAKLLARVGSSRYRCTIRVKKAKGAKSIVLTASQIKKAGIRTSGTVKIPSSFRYKNIT